MASTDGPAAASHSDELRHHHGTSLPLIVLQQAADSKMDVMIDVVNGYRYHGKIDSFDQHMNTRLRLVTVTKVANPAFVSRMTSVFLRGQQIIDIVMPSEIVDQYRIRAKAYKKYYNAMQVIARKEKRHKAKGVKKPDGPPKR